MSLFAISDTHLSLSSDKQMDIFRGWGNYVERLKANWGKTITDGDTVVIPGDISWAMKLENCCEDFKFLNELPGEKIIMKGNHDYWWTTKRKMDDYLAENSFDTIKILHNNAYIVGDTAVCGSRGWFFDAENDGKVLLREAGRLRASVEEGLKLSNKLAVFLHYPPAADAMRCDEILDVLAEYGIKKCWFGHLHGESLNKYQKFTVNDIEFSCISADYLKFIPKLIEKQ
ncbi:MAG: metallophosphoesterase [Oscillospiraceae bacterium]|nr:metallophosphoesterase [Oscillospiraceae bacterium]